MRKIKGGAFAWRSRDECADCVPIGKWTQNQRGDCENINVDGECVIAPRCQLFGVDGVNGVEKSGAKTGQDADSTPDKRGMRVEYTADQRTADDCRKHTGDLDGRDFFMKKDGAQEQHEDRAEA